MNPFPSGFSLSPSFTDFVKGCVTVLVGVAAFYVLKYAVGWKRGRLTSTQDKATQTSPSPRPEKLAFTVVAPRKLVSKCKCHPDIYYFYEGSQLIKNISDLKEDKKPICVDSCPVSKVHGSASPITLVAKKPSTPGTSPSSASSASTSASPSPSPSPKSSVSPKPKLDVTLIKTPTKPKATEKGKATPSSSSPKKAVSTPTFSLLPRIGGFSSPSTPKTPTSPTTPLRALRSTGVVPGAKPVSKDKKAEEKPKDKKAEEKKPGQK